MAVAPSAPIAGNQIDELVAHFHAAGKPRSSWRVGAEHEKLGVLVESGAAPTYEGPRGIAALLARLAGRGWQPVEEGGHVIALTRRGASVTLEPGGQTELSGAPYADLRTIRDEMLTHRQELLEVSAPLGLAWLACGFRPLGTWDDVPWMPKGRYGVMRAYLPTRGKLGLEMMKRTATVQANLDWSDEDDARRKFRAAMSVTSLVTALWAASPVVNGVDTGMASYRASIWLDTDPDRCGIPAFSFGDGPFFASYVEWALDVPMFFVHREHWGGYRPVGGMTFRRFLREGVHGERATLADWQLHLSTLFPETRLKSYMEMRGADAGPMNLVLALPALWKGLLYDDAAVSAAAGLTAHLSYGDRLELRAAVPRSGLATKVGARGGGTTTVGALAKELVALARAGLTRVRPDEVSLLEPVEEVAATGRAPAEKIRDVFARAHGDIGVITKELAL
jgi:glutamate--cysteine ligase